jgi:DNA-binding MurR/RpiR family transcriptional regulator
MTAYKAGTATPIRETIRQHYPAMTGALRRFADFVLAEPVTAARMSIHAAVATVGVSVATANRFARALSFAGYAEFRAELIQSFAEAMAPIRRLEAQISKVSTSVEIMQASLAQDIRNLQATAAMLGTRNCRKATQLILSARRIHTIGFGNAASLVAILADGLAQIRDDVHGAGNAEGGFGAARQISRFGPKDLVIAVAFPRYMKDTITLARQSKPRGARVMAITDSPQSPLAPIADLCFYVQADRQSASTSNASALALIEALVAAAAHGAPGSLRRAEEFTSFVLPWIETRQEAPGRRKRRGT